MLAFLHPLLVAEDSSGHAEYAALALACVACVNVFACVAVHRGAAARVFEAASGASVAGACLLTLLVRGTYFPRQCIATLLMAIWGVRLSAFLYARELTRSGPNVLVRVAWSMLCATPVVICNTRQLEAAEPSRAEALAVTAALCCVALEHLADSQKAEWFTRKRQKDGACARPGRADVEPPVCHTGMWALSRHPNLFFELAFQWSVYCIVRPVDAPWVLFCPVALTVLILVFPGGVLAQEMARERAYGLYPSYVLYCTATPAFFPLPWAKRLMASVAPRAADAVCLEMEVFRTGERY